MDQRLDMGNALERTTLVDVLRERAERHPERRAFTFHVDMDGEEQWLTYGELDRRARAIAAQLQACGAVGERVLLLYPPGLEYIAGFLGCLYAGAVAVPAYPPNPARLDRTLPRLQTMVLNAGATVALTNQMIFALAGAVFEAAPDLGRLDWMATDAGEQNADLWRSPELGADTLAFLQYTSGSTGAPKGVMLAHSNIMANLALIREAFSMSSDDVGVSWLPPYHDMGLIGCILEPLYLGIQCVLMSPVSFLQRPIRWLQVISRYGVIVSGGPNFAYDLVARKATPEQIAALDLSRWQLAFNGAEPIRPETIDRFARTFAPCGFRREAFYPCYGMAETTLLVTGVPRGSGPVIRSVQADALEQGLAVAEDSGRALVGCGITRAGHDLVIVNPETLERQPDGRVGEIWVSGPSVAQGYWARPEESAATFQARTSDGAGPFLRTGDLGFVEQGELFVTGRRKDLIIIDGRNHYPQDIELTVEAAHPAIRAGGVAAFAVEVGGEERLVVAAEVERSFLSSQRRDGDAGAARQAVAAAIKRAISEQHELRSYAVVLLKTGSMPKTSSGKIQRHACRAGYRDNSLDVLED